MNKTIPYGRQSINSNDINQIIKVASGNYLTTGPKIIEFEKKIKSYTKAKYVSVCNSGTSALYLALKSINIKTNDIIIMPAVNFIASYNVCKILNAKIFLTDVDSLTGRMRPWHILDCIKKNKIKKIKAIITMHLGGDPGNVTEFFKLKKRFKCFLIEDACHALGSEYLYNKKKYKVGSAKHVDLSTFSFHPIKTITTCEGGAVTTNNKLLFKKISLFKSHGIVRSKFSHWKYNVVSPGLNFRLSDLNCALGISQMNRINKFIKERENIAKFYIKNFEKFKGLLNFSKIKSSKNSWHLFIINIDFKNLQQKDSFFKFLKKNNVYVQFHYIPIYKFSLAKNLKKMSGCEKYHKSAVSLPIYCGLKKKQQLKIIKLVIGFLKKII